jgi:hypothetical protein
MRLPDQKYHSQGWCRCRVPRASASSRRELQPVTARALMRQGSRALFVPNGCRPIVPLIRTTLSFLVRRSLYKHIFSLSVSLSYCLAFAVSYNPAPQQLRSDFRSHALSSPPSLDRTPNNQSAHAHLARLSKGIPVRYHTYPHYGIHNVQDAPAGREHRAKVRDPVRQQSAGR